jgi:hypothetical protein
VKPKILKSSFFGLTNNLSVNGTQSFQKAGVQRNRTSRTTTRAAMRDFSENDDHIGPRSSKYIPINNEFRPNDLCKNLDNTRTGNHSIPKYIKRLPAT